MKPSSMLLRAFPLLSVVLMFSCFDMIRADESHNKAEKAGTDNSSTENKGDEESLQSATHTVVVYYFYAPPRCASCRNIEKFTKEAIENEFAVELKDGSLIWMSVDVDREENKHYIGDFQLYSKSVIVADYDGEKPDKEKLLRWKNLEDVWKLLRDKPKFLEYIQDETRAHLKADKGKKDEDKNKDKNKEKTKEKKK